MFRSGTSQQLPMYYLPKQAINVYGATPPEPPADTEPVEFPKQLTGIDEVVPVTRRLKLLKLLPYNLHYSSQ